MAPSPVAVFRCCLIAATSVALMVGSGHAETSTSLQRQQQYLQQSLNLNMTGRERYPMTTRLDKTWEDWQKRTGELPPDFASMESNPLLPDPLLLYSDGKKTTVTTADDWIAQKRWVKEQFQHWISGSVPPAPDNLTSRILEESREGDLLRQLVEVRFGPKRKGRMTFELLIPPGNEPRPVYMTQWNHREWAQLAVRRGYIGCIYAGADSRDDSEPYQHLYPKYEFSRLMRRAWGASRVVDYLVSRPEVNPHQIAITGHSRNGKQSLWAAAFDERIGAVISSSCGTGGIMPWRFSDPQYCNETIDAICGVANNWFHPRLRYFFGRENRLPVDQNQLLAIIAPRPLLMTFSHMEHQSNLWAAEQCYHSAKRAYDFLHAGDNISMFVRQGEHAVAARDVERHIDFLDAKFGRRDVPWSFQPFFDFDFADWAAKHPAEATAAAAKHPAELKASYESLDAYQHAREKHLQELRWLLGDEPPGAKPGKISETAPSRIDWMDKITGRPVPSRTRTLHIGPYTSMGDHLPGTVYLPVNSNGTTRSALKTGAYPTVIYLHQYAYAHGYAFGYNPRGGSGGARNVIEGLTRKGFAVVAIDMFGFGTRLKEAEHFYQRQPGWSKMGKMVADVSAVVDAIESLPELDSSHVYVLGDTIGGVVGLMATALDKRISGIATVAAASPWRSSNAEFETLRNLSHFHGFLPRLGLFSENPAGAPVDMPEVMAAIAPRPQLIIAPTLDWHSDPKATTAGLKAVRGVYEVTGRQDALKISRPPEINRLTPAMMDEVTAFLAAQLTR